MIILGLTQTLDQGHWLALEAAREATTGTSVDELHEFLMVQVEELVQVHATVRELLEGALLAESGELQVSDLLFVSHCYRATLRMSGAGGGGGGGGTWWLRGLFTGGKGEEGTVVACFDGLLVLGGTMTLGYVDLNVAPQGRGVTQAELQRLGYRCVAINALFASDQKPKPARDLRDLPVTANEKTGKGSSKKAKMYTAMQPAALQIASGGAATEPVKRLRRVTLKIDDMGVAQSLGSNAALKDYDLIAVEAGTAKVFQFLCEQADIDIITFDVTNRLPFTLKRPWLDAAIKRQIFFEITYTPCLGDSAGRRYFFSNASNLVRVTGGRHLLLSSYASRDILLRSPYDVINLGILVGLTYGQAHDAISASCHAVIERAERRRGLRDVVVESCAEPMEQS
ncbi:TPA: hypothetical protein N0F65_005264 [Lagenidium giganteum]|uniref:Uncharacterized protein n=1 Tax=Lagenidium giganteum TaxID=4803 RepID=A0AAV2YTU4_9STRA|nr:TPA: hypothetical protein N0F65_005264 [Lagenidium giganteum]